MPKPTASYLPFRVRFGSGVGLLEPQFYSTKDCAMAAAETFVRFSPQSRALVSEIEIDGRIAMSWIVRYDTDHACVRVMACVGDQITKIAERMV